ncbi:hypothetical protein U1P98_23395 [Lysinibacillus irui]|uniref:Uncharacterized protein n=1 Tax=Lysinibacillus irui TaxID=2998077 RepID=A0ABU5NT34_9BACI|nr:hypothetical protein [Lysinibacillus irui]MEA0556504.1 hypothetical protein [Lysinibacillus irui]MEA0979228.1 hypothetical protein [Lysinibacillus irui]MEA1045382.1 hypothetical protein [Lysinibacillus irui]
MVTKKNQERLKSINQKVNKLLNELVSDSPNALVNGQAIYNDMNWLIARIRQLEKLEAEHKRYRIALKEIAVQRRSIHGYVPVKNNYKMCEIANKALEDSE